MRSFTGVSVSTSDFFVFFFLLIFRVEALEKGFAWTISFSESSADLCISLRDRTDAASVSDYILKKDSKYLQDLS